VFSDVGNWREMTSGTCNSKSDSANVQLSGGVFLGFSFLETSVDNIIGFLAEMIYQAKKLLPCRYSDHNE